MWKIHGTTMWLEKLNILTNLSKSNRNYLLSCSYKGICTLYYLSSSLLIFLFYFLLLWWNIAQKAQKRIGGLLSFSSKILRLCDRYGSVNDHWKKNLSLLKSQLQLLLATLSEQCYSQRSQAPRSKLLYMNLALKPFLCSPVVCFHCLSLSLFFSYSLLSPFIFSGPRTLLSGNSKKVLHPLQLHHWLLATRAQGQDSRSGSFIIGLLRLPGSTRRLLRRWFETVLSQRNWQKW